MELEYVPVHPFPAIETTEDWSRPWAGCWRFYLLGSKGRCSAFSPGRGRDGHSALLGWTRDLRNPQGRQGEKQKTEKGTVLRPGNEP